MSLSDKFSVFSVFGGNPCWVLQKGSSARWMKLESDEEFEWRS